LTGYYAAKPNLVLPLAAPSRQLAPMILTPRTTPTAPWARGCSGEKSASGIFLYISKKCVGKTAAKYLKTRLVKSAVFTKSASGVRYYGFRYYNANIGRWISKDPIEEQGGLNLYGMVSNDVVNRWDYLGLSPVLKATTVGSIYAGNAGEYSWTIQWSVSDSSDSINGGQILQDVEYRYDIKDCSGKSLRNDTVKYSEIWRVLPGSTTVDGFAHKNLTEVDYGTSQNASRDTFSGVGYSCTKGSITEVGYARYHSNQAQPNPAWSEGFGGNGTYSGNLQSSLKNPNWPKGPSTSKLVKRSIRVRWDACGEGSKKTEIMYNSIE